MMIATNCFSCFLLASTAFFQVAMSFKIGSLEVNPEDFKLPGPVDSFFEQIKGKQVACVSGKLTCASDEDQEKNVMIKMWDIDRWNFDDTMGSAQSDQDGFFDFCGAARDFNGDIEPMIEIYHKCPYSKTKPVAPKCYRKVNLQIPQSYVDASKYEILDDIQLDAENTDEEEECD